jgi:hypothetical protein
MPSRRVEDDRIHKAATADSSQRDIGALGDVSPELTGQNPDQAHRFSRVGTSGRARHLSRDGDVATAGTIND